MDKSGNIKWYVDAALAVHKDMRRNNGVFVNMITVRACVQSINNNKNTNISTETELFIVDNVLTQVICTGYFPKEKGYEIHYNVIY